MRILMASKRAPGTPGRRDGGVQTWVSTVTAELRRLGHGVDVIGGGWDGRGEYDAGIFANAAHTLRDSFMPRRTLLICHGIVDDEGPADWDGPVAFTSEEVRDHWKGDGPIIRQPIDLEFWSPGPRRTARTLVRYANRGGLEWLPEVAARLGLQFVHVRNATPEQARGMLRDAAVVLASGRCAVEAMACGAPVVVCDDRPYQGPMLDMEGEEAMPRNYSGRGGATPDVESVLRVVKSERMTTVWRAHAERHHDVRQIVPQLLEAACCTC